MTSILHAGYAHTMIDMIRSAEVSIEVLCYVVNLNIYKRADNANLIFCAMRDFVSSGGKVQVLLDLPCKWKSNYNQVKFFTRRFKEAGFTVRWSGTYSTQHSKLFLFDRKFAVAGSHNWTTRSVVSALDISFVFDDPLVVSHLVSFFDSLWSTALVI